MSGQFYWLPCPSWHSTDISGLCNDFISLYIEEFLKLSSLKLIYILTYLLTELSPPWEAANCAAIQEIPSNFKKPEGSSPCSQEPSTGPYPEPVWSSPYHPIKAYLYIIKKIISYHTENTLCVYYEDQPVNDVKSWVGYSVMFSVLILYFVNY
jgi:hypothetical protein